MVTRKIDEAFWTYILLIQFQVQWKHFAPSLSTNITENHKDQLSILQRQSFDHIWKETIYLHVKSKAKAMVKKPERRSCVWGGREWHLPTLRPIQKPTLKLEPVRRDPPGRGMRAHLGQSIHMAAASTETATQLVTVSEDSGSPMLNNGMDSGESSWAWDAASTSYQLKDTRAKWQPSLRVVLKSP